MHALGVEHDIPPGAQIIGTDAVDDKVIEGEETHQGKEREKNIQ
jgi:hypothetical protein